MAKLSRLPGVVCPSPLIASLLAPSAQGNVRLCSFSLHGMGSYILFVHFTLQIDNCVDSLVSYRSVGARYDLHHDLNYAEPRASCVSVRPALILDDNNRCQMPSSLPPTPVAAVVAPDEVPPTMSITEDKLLHPSTEEPLSVGLLRKLHSGDGWTKSLTYVL